MLRKSLQGLSHENLLFLRITAAEQIKIRILKGLSHEIEGVPCHTFIESSLEICTITSEEKRPLIF